MQTHPDKLWLETPLIHSVHISSLLGCNAYLKLENLQPPQSFKARGISLFAQKAIAKHGPDVRLVIASGGNAGLAAAWAAKALNIKCTVYGPTSLSQSTASFLRKQGAEVVIGGDIYLHALQRAQEAVKDDPKAVMVPAYDDPIVWEGHSSMIHEIQRQLPEGTKPDAIFCTVGGAGLIGGVIVGCKAVGWDDVPLVGMETHGCACFYQALSLNQGPFSGDVQSRLPPKGVTPEYCSDYNVTVAHLSELPTRAKCLSASSAAPGVVKMALERSGPVKSVSVSDEMAMDSALRFTDDHKLLVELACSVVMTPAYNPSFFQKLVPKTDKPATVVFIVCGGFTVSTDELEGYKQVLEADALVAKEWDVACNGERWAIPKSA